MTIVVFGSVTAYTRNGVQRKVETVHGVGDDFGGEMDGFVPGGVLGGLVDGWVSEWCVSLKKPPRKVRTTHLSPNSHHHRVVQIFHVNISTAAPGSTGRGWTSTTSRGHSVHGGWSSSGGDSGNSSICTQTAPRRDVALGELEAFLNGLLELGSYGYLGKSSGSTRGTKDCGGEGACGVEWRGDERSGDEASEIAHWSSLGNPHTHILSRSSSLIPRALQRWSRRRCADRPMPSGRWC